MAVNFSLTCVKEKGNFESKFHSVTGEEYVVKLHIKNTHHEEAKMTLEWKNPCNRHISASFFTETYRLLGSKFRYVEDAVSASMAVHPSSHIIGVNVAPCVPLEIIKPQSKNLVSKGEKPVVEMEFKKLSTDMRDLLYSQTGDVVLTVGSHQTEIHVHKVILSARSSVFDKMFQHQMKENRENRVVIEDISVEVMRELLHFMYTGTARVQMTDDRYGRYGKTFDLYVAADKYDVMQLKEICATVLMTSMNLFNVLGTLLLADLCSDELLKEVAMNFISRNYPQLKMTWSWEQFITEHQSLAIEVMDYVLDKRI